MPNHDSERNPDLSPDEIQWEQDRASSLRTFEVTVQDGSTCRVLAHSWYSDDTGCALFVTIQPSGRSLIHDGFAASTGWYVKEVTPPALAWYIDQISRRRHTHVREHVALAKMPPVNERKH